uniref:Chromatin associated protein KTI12 n=1 Tax=Panagrolaimus sp. PS1159 TaxID=55785 RepID=A0AC35FHL9_9BILA
MPFLLITGLPSSGKSTIVNRISDFITQKGIKVEIIREEDYGDFSRESYNDAKKEKQWRSSIRRDVSKHIGQQALVICDGLNYVKGYRYELFTQAKNNKVTFAVLHINADVKTCKNLNNIEKKYSDEKIDELASRYENPDATKRWDSPLITVDISDSSLPKEAEIDFDQIYSLLFETVASKPNLCTIEAVEHSESSFKNAEIITHEINAVVCKNQKNIHYGGKLEIPHTEKEFIVKKYRSPAELSRLRFQFLNIAKTRTGLQAAGDLYVDFLNSVA